MTHSIRADVHNDVRVDHPAEPTDRADRLRAFMAGFPTGVGVLTTLDAGNHPWGMTCTSISCVTLSPPTLLVCLRQGSPTLEAVRAGGTFALNLLSGHARSTAELFASGAPDRFARTPWCLPAGAGGPHLDEAAHGVADCKVVRDDVVGDHAVIFGEVLGTAHRSLPDPLLYGLRGYAAWPGQP
ncbi:flavin reductase family protein [Embleya hyalina]|uniref:Flavin-dependent monooxygenase, reductase subunit HsaB n=1 Tax=Embleya hyalina TaxID=516124 RepID=A0A401Z651_9ACTN|nr:flavin reductase family protein [Embleya hyalina]GCE02309.1 flavin-dependent monooxygenase, reductase subunit HsaB [Embleya hyalina]